MNLAFYIKDANGNYVAAPVIAGRWIESVEQTSGTGAAGTTDTFTITFSDSTTSTFTVYNGANGENGTDGENGANGEDATETIVRNTDAAPALGSLSHNTEYRCTNSSITTAPSFTLVAISATNTRFYASVVFKAPNATAPVVTNSSGYTLKYQGKDTLDGTFTPVAGTVYRYSIVFDGIYVNIYVSGA